MKNITTILIVLITTLGASAVIAAVGYSSIKALGRNPAASPKILTAMMLAFIFAEAIAIIAILLIYMLFG
ncbi:MAG: ATPase [Candidatus Omnitrophica bacterium]|nr:ATPase [Candidatus Omnitrophota bacterium]MCK5492186.1 ATPase [Candidatus Omnitrophota bacterium]